MGVTVLGLLRSSAQGTHNRAAVYVLAVIDDWT